MRNGIAGTLLLVGGLLLVIGSLMLISTSHAVDPNAESTACIVNDAGSPDEACEIRSTGIGFRMKTY